MEDDDLGFAPKFPTATILLQPIYEHRAERRTIHALEANFVEASGEPHESSSSIFDNCETASELAQADRACIRMAFESARELPGFSIIAIKAHGFSLAADNGFLAYLQRMSHLFALDLSRFILEVSDYDVWWSQFELDDILKRFRRTGIKIALGESGSFPPDVRLFRQVRPEYFKVNRFTVHAMWADALKFERFKDLVRTAEGSGARVVADGIEDEADLRCALEAGAELTQGNHLSRPLPVTHWKRIKFEQPLFSWRDANTR